MTSIHPTWRSFLLNLICHLKRKIWIYKKYLFRRFTYFSGKIKTNKQNAKDTKVNLQLNILQTFLLFFCLTGDFIPVVNNGWLNMQILV